MLQDKLLPKPEEDVAAALRFILANREKFGLRNTDYIVNDFSAGASVTVIWGTEQNGWKKNGMPRPKAMFTIYPVISSEYNYEPAKDWLLTMMFGKDYDMATVKSFDIPETFTAAYPPCYIIHAKDDSMVPVRNSIELKALLDGAGTLPGWSSSRPAATAGATATAPTRRAGLTARRRLPSRCKEEKR